MRTHLLTITRAPAPPRKAFGWHAPSLWAAVWLVLLSGCATTPQLASIGKGGSVSIVVIKSPQSDGTVVIRNLALANDSLAGSASGMMIGGLYGLACGPLAVLCIPAGMGMGAIYGTLAGAAVGLTAALPDDKAAQLRDRLSRAQQQHDLLDELRSNVIDRAREQWELNSEASATVVTVELQDIVLTSTRDERIGLIVRVLVTVRPGGSPLQTAPKQKLYEYIGAFYGLAVWLDERSDLLDTSFSSASQQIATQIVSELALH